MAMGPTPAGTFLTTGANKAIGQREDLIDKIFRIDPTDTPFYTNAQKAGAEAIYHEWQTQALAAPAANAQPEGFTATMLPPTPTVRLGNYCQIMAKTWSVSRTLNVVNKAGRDREVAYQQLLKGLELRRELEATLTGLLGQTAKVGTDPRKMAPFAPFCGNVGVGVGGNAGTVDGNTAIVSGTGVVLTKDRLDDIMEATFLKGGEPNTLLCSTTTKRAFSQLMNVPGTATAEYRITEATEAALIGAVSVWVSDFGKMYTMIDRFTPVDQILGMDWDYVTVCALPNSNFITEDLARTGDNEAGMIVWEGTLQVDAPNAHFALMGVLGT